VVHIVLLADRERLVELFTRSVTLSGATLRVVNGIGDALTGLSGRGPFFFFIQERLGELSGELIASRLASELKGRSVRLFLLGNPASGGDIFHGVVDESLPDDELTEAVRALVFAPLPETRKRRSPPKKKADVEIPEISPVSVPEPVTDPPLPTEGIDDIVEIGRPVSPVERIPPQRSASPENAAPVAGPRFQDLLESALEESVEPKTPDNKTPVPEITPRTALPDNPIPEDPGAVAGAEGVRGRTLRPGRWFLLLGAIAVGTLLLFLTLCRTEKPPAREKTAVKDALSLPKETPAASPAPPRSLRTVPSFVPRRSPDPVYGKANPGWELYRSSGADFRIYRENGLILAIQTIDRSGAGLAPALLSSALTEISGSRNYLVETQERKGSYRIEKGRLKNGAAILIYRKEPDRKVKAFVVDFR
jgi:hypothetical protein